MTSGTLFCLHFSFSLSFRNNADVHYFKLLEVVFTNAKILILKLITTVTDDISCKFWVVFTNAKILILKLITTHVGFQWPWSSVVFTNAKILILKLITTHRYFIDRIESCIYQCKDTNFKANHNGCPAVS